ncbi:endonuclease VII [Pelagibacter phage HTVC100P]|nr:endonuclease VII [Pelagibacter phage HTVC100P]
MQTIECKKCSDNLPLDNFYFNKNGKYKKQNVCKKCMNIYDYKTDKNSKLKRAYGITFDEYEELLSKQNKKCAICGIDNNGKYRNKPRAFAVDHCHTKGKIRGLLCSDCNTGIGLLKDNINFLQSAINYLNKLKN